MPAHPWSGVDAQTKGVTGAPVATRPREWYLTRMSRSRPKICCVECVLLSDNGGVVLRADVSHSCKSPTIVCGLRLLHAWWEACAMRQKMASLRNSKIHEPRQSSLHRSEIVPNDSFSSQDRADARRATLASLALAPFHRNLDDSQTHHTIVARHRAPYWLRYPMSLSHHRAALSTWLRGDARRNPAPPLTPGIAPRCREGRRLPRSARFVAPGALPDVSAGGASRR